MKIHNLLTIVATATLITNASAYVTMDWVTIENLGNATDTGGYGYVDYEYRIGKYEVTNSQYAAFLNAKGASNSGEIYTANMAYYGITQSGSFGSFTYHVTGALANRPVVYVSWFDAARFANWMVNGQGSGDMETGAYTLNGATRGIITANIGAQVYIPTRDEWAKAAFYNAATRSFIFKQGSYSYNLATERYELSPTSYGTFNQSGPYYLPDYDIWSGDYWGSDLDQSADVLEWSDGVFLGSREYLGMFTSVADYKEYTLSPLNMASDPEFEEKGLGFRLASIPELSSIFLTIFASGIMLIRRKR